ncbi:MAG TPA: glycosyltransferase family 4 protein, partial [Polyangiaceae bacterium]|nr:glycosyltransferase family 4 protein [Polyangiaceae bacterium]
MRLLLVSTVYPPAIGGPALQTRDIAATLTQHGHDVTVLTTSPAVELGASPSTGLGINEFEVIHLPQQRRGFDRVGRNLRLLREVDRVVLRVKPNLVHMQTCEGNVPFVVGAVARAQRIPRLIKFSSDFVWARLNRDRYLGLPYQELHRSSLGARLLTQAQRTTLAQYNLVWATSPFVEQSLQKVYGLRPEVLHALPNLIRLSNDALQPRTTRSECVVLLVARLVPTKGIEVALEALAQLSESSVRLRIVGEGAPAYEASLRKLSVGLGVQHRVDFVGAVPPAKLTQEYDSADLLLLPSWYEAFGIVLVQAMARGLPCVASNVGGIPSVVRDGETGLLFPPGDV